MTAIPLRSDPPSRWWLVAQVAGLALTAGLLAGLVVRPAFSLTLLWDMVIPLLPAVFLVSPMLWRNVCPLATLNQWSGRLGRGRIRGGPLQAGWVAGVALLFVMVPARRFLFNEHGVVLAATVAAVALLALGSGFLFSRRAGFCNTLCPVLPVEKLYGQAPMLRISSAVCPDCTGCAARGCFDLVGGRSLAQTVGTRPDGPRWLTAPLGVFSLLFPGFVYGYNTTVNGGLDTALGVYAHIGVWMAGGAVTLGLLILLFRVPARVALPAIGAGSLALYYWFAGPVLATAWGVPSAGPVAVRGAAFGLIAVWLVLLVRPRSPASG